MARLIPVLAAARRRPRGGSFIRSMTIEVMSASAADQATGRRSGSSRSRSGWRRSRRRRCAAPPRCRSTSRRPRPRRGPRGRSGKRARSRACGCPCSSPTVAPSAASILSKSASRFTRSSESVGSSAWRWRGSFCRSRPSRSLIFAVSVRIAAIPSLWRLASRSTRAGSRARQLDAAGRLAPVAPWARS